MARTIRYATLIHVRRADVFRAVATADGWNAWFTTSCELEPFPGGAFRPVWKQFGPDKIDSADDGRVLAIRAPELIQCQWNAAGPDHPTVFTLVLERSGRNTVVRMTDEGYPDASEEQVARLLDCSAAWGEALTLLKFHCEYGVSYVPRDGD